MNTKYVVIDIEPFGPQMFIFSEFVNHRDFAKQVMANPKDEVVSAGFIMRQTQFDLMQCYGESMSLGVKSNPERDNELLWKLLFNVSSI